MTTKIIEKAKESAAATKDRGIQDGPSAVVGLSGLQRAVAQLFGRGVHFVDTVEECRGWLVNQSEKTRQGDSALRRQPSMADAGALRTPEA